METHDDHEEHGHEEQDDHQDHDHGEDHDHGSHHAEMVEDFRRRFWVSLALTVPILALSPMIQGFLGLTDTLAFPGDSWILLGFSTAVFFYGGWPFLVGLVRELRQRQTGMMTLIALAITVAYVYSAATVFGLRGEPFFWELATLIDAQRWLRVIGSAVATGRLDRGDAQAATRAVEVWIRASDSLTEGEIQALHDKLEAVKSGKPPKLRTVK